MVRQKIWSWEKNIFGFKKHWIWEYSALWSCNIANGSDHRNWTVSLLVKKWLYFGSLNFFQICRTNAYKLCVEIVWYKIIPDFGIREARRYKQRIIDRWSERETWRTSILWKWTLDSKNFVFNVMYFLLK